MYQAYQFVFNSFNKNK